MVFPSVTSDVNYNWTSGGWGQSRQIQWAMSMGHMTFPTCHEVTVHTPCSSLRFAKDGCISSQLSVAWYQRSNTEFFCRNSLEQLRSPDLQSPGLIVAHSGDECDENSSHAKSVNASFRLSASIMRCLNISCYLSLAITRNIIANISIADSNNRRRWLMRSQVQAAPCFSTGH